MTAAHRGRCELAGFRFRARIRGRIAGAGWRGVVHRVHDLDLDGRDSRGPASTAETEIALRMPACLS